jgi:hypothetical protein
LPPPLRVVGGGGAGDLGLVMAGSVSAMLIGTLFGGVRADRLQPRLVMVGSDLIRLAAAASMALRVERGPRESVLHDLRAGWREISSLDWLVGGLFGATAYHIGNGVILVLVQVVAIERLGGATSAGFITSAEGVGGLIGAALALRLRRRMLSAGVGVRGIGQDFAEYGDELRLRRNSGGSFDHPAAGVQDQECRCAPDAERAHCLEVAFRVDLDVTHARQQVGHLGTDPPHGPARRAERRRELQQRRLRGLYAQLGQQLGREALARSAGITLRLLDQARLLHSIWNYPASIIAGPLTGATPRIDPCAVAVAAAIAV